MTLLKTECYSIKDGKIVRGTLNDFVGYIETMPHSWGIDYKYLVDSIEREVHDDMDQADCDSNSIIGQKFEEIWVLTCKEGWASYPRVVMEFNSEEEANAAVEGIYTNDILNNNHEPIFLDFDEASHYLSEMND